MKYFIHGQEETKHIYHIGKNLHFTEETMGLIIRIHANNPREGAEKLQKLIEDAKDMASAILPADSIPMKISMILILKSITMMQ